MKRLLSVVLLTVAIEATPAHAQMLATASLPKNFAKVSDGIYRGARPTPAQIDAIASIGIRQDISLQGGDLTNPFYRIFVLQSESGEQPSAIENERSYAQSKGLIFANAPLDCFDPISATEDAQINYILKRLNQASATYPVYLHCEHGKDRTGLVIALYRVEHDGWTPQEAFNEWEKFGHNDLAQVVLDDLDRYFWSKAKSFSR